MQYTRNPPLEADTLAADPLEQFRLWLASAQDAGMLEPTAFSLATVGADLQPSARIVLLKGFHDGGLCFYTSHEGRKGRELEAHPRAAATFWWDRLERQVRFEGAVQRLPRELVQRYFDSRPRESQLGALTSQQSQVVADRETLDARFAANAARYTEGAVPLPAHWGGYVLRPAVVEFWQGRLGRLHDRLRYRQLGGGWIIERLEP